MDEQNERTPSEVLIETMEEFGDAEPENIIVVYTNVNRDVVIKSNARRVECLGLLEAAKAMVMIPFLKGK